MKHDFCALRSAQAQEPIWGTAQQYKRMLFIGLPKQKWTSNQWQSRGLPERAKVYLSGLRGDPRRVAPRLFNMPEAETNQTSLLVCPDMYRVDHVSFDDLPDIAESIFDGQRPVENVSEMTGRHMFICTHGVRDKCCAKFGFGAVRAIKRTLAENQELAASHTVWETSHLVGDRFAGTGIVYPEGRMYGRLTEDTASGWLDIIAAGDVAFDQYRGSVFLSQKQQIVAAALQQNYPGIDELSGISFDEPGGESQVPFTVADPKTGEKRFGSAYLTQQSLNVQTTCKQVAAGVFAEKTVWQLEQLVWE